MPITPDYAQHLAAARDEEVRRGSELLSAAMDYWEGDIGEETFLGFVCRYGAACKARAMLIEESNNALN